MIYFFNYTIGPYHIARYNELWKLLPDRIVIVELASKVGIYPWASRKKDFNTITLFPGETFESINPQNLAKRVSQLLDKEKPQTVISVSYASPAMRQATIWARNHNAVSIGVSDTWKGDKTRYFPLEILKGMWCRFFYDGMFLSASRSKAYYSGIGFPENRIWAGHNVVDNNYYSLHSLEVIKCADQYRNKYHLPVNFFLCIARLSPEKNLKRLLTAYAMYKRMNGTWDLVLVGSGRLEGELKGLATSLDIASSVHFIGWREMDELPVFYGLASCLILPSISETWGNVVNEAMASGLPVLVSEKCGCLPELCLRGINGFQFDPFNLSDLTDCMLRMSSGFYDIHKMGEKSKEIVRAFSPENYALSLCDAINTLGNIRSLTNRKK